jgi:hypothetical protein
MNSRFVGALTFAAVGAAISFVMNTSRISAGTHELDLLRVAAGDCDNECNTCPLHNGHSFDVCPDCGSYETDDAHACVYNQSCSAHGHTRCSPEGPGFANKEERLAVILALLDGSPDQIGTLLAKYRGVVEYNSSRRLFQIIGCNGNVFANIPSTSNWIGGAD